MSNVRENYEKNEEKLYLEEKVKEKHIQGKKAKNKKSLLHYNQNDTKRIFNNY